MAKMQWTEEQQAVIDARGTSLLVSAAAGSGKTAVLVARILKMIADPEEPVPVDRLMVMTFTRAAAEEMRERLSSALRERIQAEPDNLWLQMQKAMLPRARIATIDSICQNLVRQNYAVLGLDPNFRVAEEGELRMMENDVLSALLEERYETGEEAFTVFLESFGSRTDERVRELILRLYRFARANPWPEEFLQEAKKEAEAEARGELRRLRWMEVLFSDVHRRAHEFESLLRTAAELCAEEGGPLPYLPSVQEFLSASERLREISEYPELYAYLQKLSFSALKPVRGAKFDAELKDRVKAVCDLFRDYIKKLMASYALLSPETLQKTLFGAAPSITELLTLTEEFSAHYEAARREQNIVDFNDLEHLALRLLYAGGTGSAEASGAGAGHEPGPFADRLSGEFSEILIDEYQDSNAVQEALLTALSAERFGRADVFMVGDVKQSIYRFRLARPEIFMEKYLHPGETLRRIELNKNFRSRKEVLCAVNDVFFRLMQADVGGIDYTEETALHPGAVFADPPKQQSYETELLMLDLSGKEEDGEELEKMEYEGQLIAEKIRALVSPGQPEKAFLVSDSKNGGFRPARYSDIIILLRAPGSSAERLVDTLTAGGIPAHTENASGYFNAVEVETILSLLSIIDNPHQDIALASVLRSPLGNFTDAELAELRSAFDRDTEGQFLPSRDLYAALCHGAGGSKRPEDKEANGTSGTKGELAPVMLGEKLREKAAAFLAWLLRLREHGDFLPVHRLLSEIYQESGYYAYVSARPLGDQRRKNLDMLLNQAERFGSTSYSGLFQFVRYIETIRKYDTDYGEASALSEQDDVVRITSIHKAKGLEYPIVILAGMDKAFNRTDQREAVLMDADLGVAADYVDLAERLRYPGLKREVLSGRLLSENCGEELRVLYVGMTRAKEKLILTAAVRDAEKKLSKGRSTGALLLPSGRLPESVLLSSGSYLELLLAAMGNEEKKQSIRIRVISPGELRLSEAERRLEGVQQYEKFLELDPREVIDRGFEEALSMRLHAVYAWEADTKIQPKKTVSEMKRELEEKALASEVRSGGDGQPSDTAQDTADLEKQSAADAMDLDDRSDLEDCFLEACQDSLYLASGQEKPAAETEAWEQTISAGQSGANRGTAYHRALQLLRLPESRGAEAALTEMTASGLLPMEEAKLVEPGPIDAFLRSGIGERMAKAAIAGTLYREQRFMIGIPASELSKEAGVESDSLQLLQGIVDAYFENEDGSLTLVDYKTDRLYHRTEEEAEAELVRRYHIQLDLYAQALSQLTEKPVREKIIYSTYLGREILL